MASFRTPSFSSHGKGANQVRQTYEKIMQLEFVALGFSVLFALVALFQSSIIFLVFSFYSLAVSLACDAYSHRFTSYRQFQGKKQLARAVIIFLLGTALFFR